MSEYIRNDQTNIDLNFGLSHQAIAVAHYLYEALPRSFIQDNDSTSISDTDGFEINTQVLLNGREKGLILRVAFEGKFVENEGTPILTEQLINFGESRGSDDIFVMWSEPFDEGGGSPGYGILSIHDLGVCAYDERRKQFPEGRVGEAATFIVGMICKLYKRAKKIERKLERKTRKAS